jgi:Tfp pilus assembly protein PilV
LRRSSGFSLLEATVAIAILAVGVVMVMQLFSGTLRTVRKSGDYSTALFYARSLMDEAYIKETPSEINGYFDLGDGFEGERAATAVSTSEEGVALYGITVTVKWPPSESLSLRGARAFYEKAE